MGRKQMARPHSAAVPPCGPASFLLQLSVVQSSDLSAAAAADKIKGRLCAAVAFDSVIEKKLSLAAMMYSPV